MKKVFIILTIALLLVAFVVGAVYAWDDPDPKTHTTTAWDDPDPKHPVVVAGWDDPDPKTILPTV